MDSYRENGCFTCLCEYFNTVVRVVGVILAIVFWIVGINGVPLTNPEFFYLLFLAIVVSILEGLFLFESCITSCCDHDGCCGKTWKVVLFVDNWKRSILYAALSVPCLFLKMPWIIVSGVLLIILAILYLARTYKIMRMTPASDTGRTTDGNQSKKEHDNSAAVVEKAPVEHSANRADDEMGKRGDAGFGSWEERYPQ